LVCSIDEVDCLIARSDQLNADAIADGERPYASNCITDMAPMEPARWARRWSARDVVYKQVLTDPGMFSIIYGGASRAMQSIAAA